VAAHAAMEAPTKTCFDPSHAVDLGICFATAFFMIFLFHRLVAVHLKRQYYAIHVFANSVISFLTFRAALSAVMNPTDSTIPMEGESAASQLHLNWVYAVHIYHPLFFRTNSMDWIHHVPVYVLNTLMFSILSGNVVSLCAIILTGIPGGIDYVLLVMLGEEWITRPAYKDISGHINNWMRAPLGFLGGYICLLGLFTHIDKASPWQIFVMLLIGVHNIWNAAYFGRQAIEANIVDTINRMQAEKEERLILKLPDVRAESGGLSKFSGQFGAWYFGDGDTDPWDDFDFCIGDQTDMEGRTWETDETPPKKDE